MKSINNKFVFAALFVMLALPLVSVQAAISESGFELETIATGLTLPTAMTFAEDGRIFVAEKGGTVRVIENGILVPDPVITLTDINTFGDRGLLGIATDPDFTNNGYLYLSYTYENTPGANVGGDKTGRIVRVTVIGNTADETSKVVIVGTVGGSVTEPSCENFAVTADCIPSDSSSHSVGGLRFGPDGKLYATLGDGANFDYADFRSLRAQDIDSLAGKMIRINTDGTAPADNPFYNGDPNANRSKVFVLGLRNSFRFNFNPTTGAIFAGDVGWSDWEELNHIVPGGNYGWPCIEGTSTTSHNCTPSSATTDPVYFYAHDGSGAGSVTAGAFPSNNAYPDAYDTSLFLGDYAQNWIKRIVIDQNNSLVSVENFDDSPNGPVDVSTGPDGTIYYLAIYTGDLNRLTHTSGNRRPVPTVNATPNSGLLPLQVNFSSVGSYDPDGDALTYEWDFGNGATSTEQNPSHTYTVSGSYTAFLKLTDSHGSVATKSIEITAGNQAPEAIITNPSSGTLYVPNQVIQLNGNATDLEDGTLPASAYHWRVIIHHNVHIHISQEFDGVKNPSFVAPDHNATDVYTEIELTVTDSDGLTDVSSINLYLNNGSNSGNLIANPSLEMANETSGQPLGWHQGWYGNMGVDFTYPVAGFEDARAARVTVTDYVEGDAKWYFDPVLVTPGEDYHFSDHYTATAETKLYVQFALPNGTYQYLNLGTLPIASTPTRVDRTITVPEGVETMTVFHQLSQNGTLTVDDFSLTLASEPLPAPTNLVANPNLEIEDGAEPQNWNKGTWGNHTAVFTYPVTGHDGNKAARVEITNYPANGTGDSKWVFDKVPVTPGTQYTFSDHYRSNTISDIIGQYTLSGGTYHYFGLAKELQPNTTWQTVSGTFTPPSDATHVTFFHLISSQGYVEIDDLSMYTSGTSTPSETNAPVVEFTNPLEGQTVSGTVAITASSTDDTGVTYIFYAVDGNPVTGQITTAPYLFNWDTTTVSNGTHLLKATTHDPFGNNSTHTISVTVDNSTPPPTGENLIQNPSLETNAGNGNPSNWSRGGWGTNTRTYTYPVAGTHGASAAKVEVSDYVNGDAKWYFADVPVTAGTSYTFSEQYKSSVPTEVLARYTSAGGAVQYQYLGSVPANANWTTNSYELVPPLNTASMTIFHILFANGTLEIDNYRLALTSASGGDTTAPTASVTSPNASSTVSGVVTVSSNAADNVGVTGVTLLIDGVAGTEDTTAPYTFSWDTTAVSNGSHTVAVRARDAAGNTTPSATVTVTVNNESISSSNLIQNPSLETVGGDNDPLHWFRAGWGSNTRTFTFPVAGFAGSNAARVEIANYVDGDAKWCHEDVAVTPGATYTLSHTYRSNANTNITIRYTRADGSFQYISLGNRPATSEWQTVTHTFVVPAGAVSMTVMHILHSNGWLETDDFTLTSGNAHTFDHGMVSYTFDDGWLTHYTEALPILDAVDADGTFYIVSQETMHPPTELIVNESVESDAGDGTPSQWFKGGWGNNTRVLSYPVAGIDGDRAIKTEITEYTDGDAKWYFADVPVLPDNTYQLSNKYNSNVQSELLIRYTLSSGAYQYVGVAVLPSTGDTWQSYSTTITAPTDAESMTVFHLINSVGQITIDDFSLKSEPNFVNISQMLAIQASGHEIGAHSRTHPALTTLSQSEAEFEIEGSRNEILEMGGEGVTSIAYPFGDYNVSVQTITRDAGYTSGRSVDRGYNTKVTDKYALKIQQVGRTTTMSDIQGWMQQAIADKTWLILMFHQVDHDLSADLGVTPEFLEDIVQYGDSINIDIVTVREGVALMQ